MRGTSHEPSRTRQSTSGVRVQRSSFRSDREHQASGGGNKADNSRPRIGSVRENQPVGGRTRRTAGGNGLSQTIRPTTTGIGGSRNPHQGFSSTQPPRRQVERQNESSGRVYTQQTRTRRSTANGNASNNVSPEAVIQRPQISRNNDPLNSSTGNNNTNNAANIRSSESTGSYRPRFPPVSEYARQRYARNHLRNSNNSPLTTPNSSSTNLTQNASSTANVRQSASHAPIVPVAPTLHAEGSNARTNTRNLNSNTENHHEHSVRTTINNVSASSHSTTVTSTTVANNNNSTERNHQHPSPIVPPAQNAATISPSSPIDSVGSSREPHAFRQPIAPQRATTRTTNNSTDTNSTSNSPLTTSSTRANTTTTSPLTLSANNTSDSPSTSNTSRTENRSTGTTNTNVGTITTGLQQQRERQNLPLTETVADSIYEELFSLLDSFPISLIPFLPIMFESSFGPFLEAIIPRYYEHIERQQLNMAIDESMTEYKSTAHPPKKVTIKDHIVTKKELEDFPACSICLCEFQEGEHTAQIKCGHFFHKDCLSPWFCENSTCPMCRCDIDEG